LFSDILQVSFPYAPKSRKTAGRTPEIGGKPEIVVVDVSFADRFLASTSLADTMNAAFVLHRENYHGR